MTPQYKIFSTKSQSFLKDTNTRKYFVHSSGKIYSHIDSRGTLFPLSDSEHIVCKCSGFQTKNEDYLYEGDLVIVPIDGKKTLCEVTYSDGKFMLETVDTSVEMDLRDDAVLVGNMLENPEMILENVKFCHTCKHLATMHKGVYCPNLFTSNVFDKDYTKSVAYTHQKQKFAYMCFKNFHYTTKKVVNPISIEDSSVFPDEDKIENCLIKNRRNDCEDYERSEKPKRS
jgi:hypothetical protein